MTGSPTVKMGELAQITPDEAEEKEAFEAILASIRKNYPDDWDQWLVVNYSYEDLFGGQISPGIDSKLRFGLPTSEIVRAFYPDCVDLSERLYRHIRRMVLAWPLGRALVYSPHNIVEKVHAPSFAKFMNTIRDLKNEGKLTNRERTSKILSDESDQIQTAHSTPRSSASRKKKKGGGAEEATPVGVKRPIPPTERGNSPPPKRSSLDQGSSEHLMATMLQQQMALFNKLVEMQTEQSKRIDKLQQLPTSSKVPEPDLNASFESIPDSTHNEDKVITPSRSPIINESSDRSRSRDVSIDTDTEETVIKDGIAKLEQRLKEIKASKKNGSPSPIDFAPNTKESESKFSKADPVLAQQGIHCQRLGCEEWKHIRYGDVQKQFQAQPVFSALKVNNSFAGVSPNWTSIALLEKFDLTLGAITNGLLQQRKTFIELWDKLPRESKQEANQEFLNSKFRENCNALLQYTCGRRAEIIQQRRNTYKIKNKALHEIIHSIPPSDTHLFREPDLSQTVKDQGGVHKFFPFKKSQTRTTKNLPRADNKERNYTYKRSSNRNANYASQSTSNNYNTKRKYQGANYKPDKNPKGQNKWKGPTKF
ncbi:hypothetical protein NE865_16328 [Phthorimaea operculella]|nr:hypothetical protein NE865_16328 [Phthorimaea operculella]